MEVEAFSIPDLTVGTLCLWPHYRLRALGSHSWQADQYESKCCLACQHSACEWAHLRCPISINSNYC